MFWEEIQETLQDLREARENIQRIKSEYESEPELINFYLPSAEYMVKQLENHLRYLFEQETQINFKSAESNEVSADIWIRLEGKNFKDGKGPIGVIGSYLQKLNVANKHAVSLISGAKEKIASFKDVLSDAASFDLVATEKGSLKIGLRSSKLSEIKEPQDEQLELFYKQEELNAEELAYIDNLAVEGFQLLAKTVASVNNEEIFDDLKEKYDENEMKKLFHYAKELVPSTRSPFDFVSFEGNIGLTEEKIITDKHTRKNLIEHEKRLRQDNMYISGTGWVRAVDLDNKTISIRPFHYKDVTVENIDCKFLNNKIESDFIGTLLEKFVSLSGFIYFNQSNSPLRLDIEEITLEDMVDVE